MAHLGIVFALLVRGPPRPIPPRKRFPNSVIERATGVYPKLTEPESAQEGGQESAFLTRTPVSPFARHPGRCSVSSGGKAGAWDGSVGSKGPTRMALGRDIGGAPDPGRNGS